MSQIQNLRNQLLVDQLLELLQSANKKRVITENQQFFYSMTTSHQCPQNQT